MKFRNLLIKCETRDYEFRAPIVPYHIKILKPYFKNIFIEKSIQRCYTDHEYLREGCILVEPGSWYNCNNDTLILGLKELDNYNWTKPINIMYFSHFIKLLDPRLVHFKNSNLWDYEYLLDPISKKRLLSFGKIAGKIGCILGLKAYTEELDIPLKSLDKFPFWNHPRKVNVAVIGPNGNCGNGVLSVLNEYKDYVRLKTYSRNEPKYDLENYDIIFNCILLDSPIEPFFNSADQFKKKTILVDISCDVKHPFNPLPVCDQQTTWECPIKRVSENFSYISIDNLPSLVPKISSNAFSEKLCDILINWDNVIMNDCLDLFKEKIKTLDIKE